MAILLTGATGFIGSHICVHLLQADYDIIALDNLSNSTQDVLEKISQITSVPVGDKFQFAQADITDYQALKAIFAKHKIEAVIHLAALKAVNESTEQPIRYYENNLVGFIKLLKVMDEHSCRKMVYSSSATIYGLPKKLPIREDHPMDAINPYGSTKLLGELILKDLAQHNKFTSALALRYFNPAGAHKSGIIGEVPTGIPQNLFPAMTRAHTDPSYKLKVFGDDYETKDGTCVRDIIHIEDLARGHLVALKKCLAEDTGYEAVNLGCGKGWTVLEIIQKFETALGTKLDYTIAARRAGDVEASYADTAYAEKYLGWKAEYGLDDICADAANFIKVSGDK